MAGEPVGGGPVVPVVFWPGSGSSVINKTAFGTFDADPDFFQEGPKVAKWICSTLGYPVVSIELADDQIYKNFEQAVMEFGSVVNEFNMREQMFNLQGIPTGSSITQKLLRSTPVPYIIKLAADYGTEAQSGGDVDVKRGYITMVNGQQEYDLQNLWAAVSESGNRIEIRRVYHERVPAMQRFFDPFAGTGTDQSALLGSFGWTGYAVASNFLIMPAYETILRGQAIELNDTIRRSGYSFEIRNNKLRIYPVPDDSIEGGAGDNVWFEYIVEADKFALTSKTSGSNRMQNGVVSDYSNAPYTFIQYQNINDVGRRWIYQYTLALCKMTLGLIRAKYESIPVPNSEIRMDGDALRQEGQREIEQLEEFLRETLEEAGKAAQLEKQKENELNSQEILKLTPNLIYIA
jgi:hypothetical protein